MANRLALAALFLTAALVALVGIAAIDAYTAPIDPLAEFRNAEGGVTVPGGAFTKELQRLLFPPPPPTTYWTYAPERLGYPTLNVIGTERDIPDSPPYLRQSESMASWDRLADRLIEWLDLGGMARDVRWLLSLDWLVGRAAAVDRFLVLGDAECTVTTIATDADCWSTTSGGNGDGLPVAGDNLVADGSSGAGTGTFDASLDITTGTVNTTGFTGTIALATFTLTNTGTITHDGGTITSGTGGIDGGAMTMSSGAPTAVVTVTGAGVWRLNSLTIQAGGTFTADAATITMDGNWDSSGGTFTQGTSTMVFAATSNLTVASGSDRGVSRLYNLTVNSSVVVTLVSAVGVSNALSVSGEIASGGQAIYLNSGAATALTCSSGTVSGGSVFVFNATGNTAISITTSCTFSQSVQMENGTSPDAAITYTVSGGPLALNNNDNYIADIVGAGSLVTLAMGANNLTGTGTNTFNIGYSVAGTNGAVTFSSGAFDVDANVSIATAGSFMDLGSSTGHTVSGTWTNATTSASWVAGSGTMLFDDATAGTMTFAGANLAEDEFSAVTFDSSATTAQTFTMATRGLRWGGTLIVDDAGAEAVNNVLDTAGLALTGGGLTLGAGGTLTLGASAVTANAAWNFSSGTYNEGTSTLTVATSLTLTPNSAGFPSANFASLTVNGSVTLTVATNILRLDENSTLTNNGTITSALRFDINVDGSPASPIAALGTISGVGGMVIASCANATYSVNLPGGTYPGPMLILQAGAGTGCTGSGTSTVATFTVTGSGMTVDAEGVLTINNGDGANNGSITLDLSASDFGLTLSATGTHIIGDSAGTGIAAINARGSTVAVSGSVSIGSNDYLDLGTSTWTVSGTWTNATTTASWNAGTSTVTFDSATGGTMTFAGANLAEDEFSAVTFTSSAGTAQTFTMATRGLRLGGTLTVSDGSSTTALDTAGLAVTAGPVTIGAGGTVTAGASTITVSGNWNSSAGTFTFGTSTVVFAANASIDVPTSDALTSRLYNLTINVSVTLTMLDSLGVANVTTVNGTLAGAFAIGVGNNTAAATPLVVGGSGSVASADTTVHYLTNGAANVASTTYTNLRINNYTGAAVDIALGNITVTNDTTLVTPLNMDTFDLTAVTYTSNASGGMQWGSGSHTISGAYTNNATVSSWDAGSGTVTFTSATGATVTFAGTNLTEDEFNNVTFTSSAGTAQTFTVSTRGPRWGGTLTITDTAGGTTLARSTAALTGGALTISGSVASGLTSTSGDATVTTVNVSTATAFITLGSGTWTVSGTWTNATTSASWDAGSGTVTFDSATGGTMTFAGANLAEDEFSAVTFTSSAGTAQTFTMATRGLRLGGTLTVSDGSSTTALDTAGLAVTAGVVTIGAGGTLTAGASTITIAGNFNFASGTFTFGTSTVVITATSTVTTPGVVNVSYFNAFTVNASVSVTWADDGAFDGLVTINNSASVSGPNFQFRVNSNMTLGTGVTTDFDLDWANTNSIPGSTYNSVLLRSASTMGGAITTTAGFNANSNVSFDAQAVLTTNGNTLTVQGTAGVGLRLSNVGAIVAGASTVTVTGNFNNIIAGGYIQFGSSTWTVSGTWTNATTSASWDAGSGTVTFDSATGGTMTFAGANLAEDEFNNVTFTSSAGTAQTFTMATRGLRLGGTLTVSDGSSTTELATAGLAVTAGPVTIGAGGTVTAGASTITVSGNWTSSAGTFTFGTSTVIFAASGNLITIQSDNGTNNTFYNLTVNVSVTVTRSTGTNVGVANIFTVNGTVTGSGGSGFWLNSSDANPIVVGGSASFGTTPVLVFYMGASYNIPASTAYPGIFLRASAGGVIATLTGAATFTGALTIGDTGTGAFALGTADLTVTGNIGVNGTDDYMTLGSGSHTFSGTWTNATTSASWDAGSGTVTFDSATGGTMTFAGANLAEDEFSAVTFNSTGATAQTFTMATRGLRWGGTLTITDGTGGTTLAKATLGLTGGALTISGAAASGLTSTSGDATVTTVSISTATAFIDLGSEAWTVSGTWTNATTSASWDAGSGTVTFDSATGGTMTFAGTNLAEDEFNNVTFTSSAGTAQTFTMATRGLRLGGTLTVSDGSSTTELATAGLAVTAGPVTIGAGGTVTAGASTITVSGTWSDATTTGLFDAGTSTVVFAAAGNLQITTAVATDSDFYNVTINASVTTTLTNEALQTNNVLTVNGTLTGAGIGVLLLGSDATPLVMGGSGSISGAGTVTYRIAADYNVAATTYSGLAIQGSGAARTATALGDITVTGAAGVSVGEDANSLLDILAMGANSLTVSGASAYSVIGGAGATNPGALTFTSGALAHSGASSTLDIGAGTGTTSYIRWGSGSHTITGAYVNASTSASWDAGSGTVTFNATSAQAMTFGNTGLGEAEFNNASFTGAVTFTATGSLYAAATITAGASATLAMGTNDLQFDRLDVNGTMTMDGQTIDDIDIDTDAGTVTIAVWTLYSVSAGVPDIQWTMDPDTASASLTIAVGGLTAFTTYALYRDNVEILQAASDGAGLVTFVFAGGWSPHGMIINLPGLVFGGGGGGGGGTPAEPIIQWTWRHLAADLTVQMVVSSTRGNQEYEWFIDGVSIGVGPAVEYVFPFSGTYSVVLKATVSKFKVIESKQDVTAVSLSFLGRYMPALVPVIIALFFVALVVADRLESDAAKLFGMGFALGLFGLAAWLLGAGVKTFPLNGLFAVQLYAGMGILATAGTLRSRAVGATLFIVGGILLAVSYLVIIPSWG